MSPLASASDEIDTETIVDGQAVNTQDDKNRRSINTFGVPDASPPSTGVSDDPLEVSAAAAAAFMDGTPVPNRKILMGPPLSTKPRQSSISTRSSVYSRVTAPERPTSPPPVDLLFRAQSPIFDETYAARSNSRLDVPSGTRGTVSTGNLRKREAEDSESTILGNGLRGAASSSGLPNGRSGAKQQRRASDQLSFSDLEEYSRTPTPAVYATRNQGEQDGRISVASSARTSEEHYLPRTSSRPPNVPPKLSRHNLSHTIDSPSTDPELIHAITQTMIGEFLHKYTRGRTIGKGLGKGIAGGIGLIGGKRHERFFWVHPYTKTLYWSNLDPGAQGGGESSAKSGPFPFLASARV